MKGLFGGGTHSEDQVRAIQAPPWTDTWHPMSHNDFLTQVENALRGHNLNIKGKEFQLTKDGNRLFSVYDLNGTTSKSDYGLSIGARNSIDKSFPAGIVFGTRVFICSNLMMKGDVHVTRKHTNRIEGDLPNRINGIISTFLNKHEEMGKLIDFWKERTMSAEELKSFLWDVGNAHILPFPFIKSKVYSLFEKPEHDDQAGRTVWTLHNAFSAALRETQTKNPFIFAHRTSRISEMLENKYAMK